MTKRANKKSQKPLTREQARERLRQAGKTCREFAHENGLKPHAVYDVLTRSKAVHGETHKAAVALGMKIPPNVE